MQEKNAFSEARGKWKCPWNLPTLVINKYVKQRAATALKPGRVPLHMQKKCTKLVSVRAWVTYMQPIPKLYALYKKNVFVYRK